MLDEEFFNLDSRVRTALQHPLTDHECLRGIELGVVGFVSALSASGFTLAAKCRGHAIETAAFQCAAAWANRSA